MSKMVNGNVNSLYLYILPTKKTVQEKKSLKTYIPPFRIKRARLDVTPKIHRMPTNLILIGPHRTAVPCTRLAHLPKPVHAAILIHDAPAMCEDVRLTVLACPGRRAAR